MPEDKTKKGEDVQVRRVHRIYNPNRQTFYANNTVVISNQWDLQLYFGLMNETKPGEFEISEQVAVVMSPEHAVALIKALQANVETFEDRNGKIREIQPIEPPNASAAPAAGPARPAVRDEKR